MSGALAYYVVADAGGVIVGDAACASADSAHITAPAGGSVVLCTAAEIAAVRQRRAAWRVTDGALVPASP
jgi:Mn2+/Fe2+ NRAMP family transporter